MNEFEYLNIKDVSMCVCVCTYEHTYAGILADVDSDLI